MTPCIPRLGLSQWKTQKYACDRQLRSSYFSHDYYFRIIVVVGSFSKGRNECCQSVILLYDRWRHHPSPPPQFRYGTGREGNILQPPALVVSAATVHKTFGPPDLKSTYSGCTRRVFGGIGHRTQAFRCGPYNYFALNKKTSRIYRNTREHGSLVAMWSRTRGRRVAGCL
ncbi:uncharacterized protein TNCV_3149421 [Trichonephila clavipes]|nr:uncharacterized protein TNCV_3149421 [Trichonephila clavipes]